MCPCVFRTPWQYLSMRPLRYNYVFVFYYTRPTVVYRVIRSQGSLASPSFCHPSPRRQRCQRPHIDTPSIVRRLHQDTWSPSGRSDLLVPSSCIPESREILQRHGLPFSLTTYSPPGDRCSTCTAICDSPYCYATRSESIESIHSVEVEPCYTCTTLATVRLPPPWTMGQYMSA